MGKKSVVEDSSGRVPAVVRGVSPQCHTEDVLTPLDASGGQVLSLIVLLCLIIGVLSSCATFCLFV